MLVNISHPVVTDLKPHAVVSYRPLNYVERVHIWRFVSLVSMQIDKIAPLIGVALEVLVEQRPIGEQLFVKAVGINHRLTSKYIRPREGHVHGLSVFSSEVEGLPEVLIGIALGQVNLVNADVGAVIENHNVPPILRQ